MAGTVTELRFTTGMGDRLRKARRLSGLRSQDIANRLDISRTTVSNYENAEEVAEMVLIAYHHITGAPIEWLRDGTISPDTDPNTGTPTGREWPLRLVA